MARVVSILAVFVVTIGCSPDRQKPGLIAVDEFSIDSYRGKVVVLNLWATWCKPCILEIPDLIVLRARFDPDRVAIVGVALDRDKDPAAVAAKVQRFVTQHQINYPVVLDHEWTLVHGDYRTEALPMTFIIDQRGEIYRAHRGLPTSKEGNVDVAGIYGADIEALLAGA